MPKRKSSKRKQSFQDDSKKGFIKSSAISSLVSVTVFFVVILIFAVVMSRKEVSPSIVNTLPFIACAIAGFAGGKTFTKGEGKRAVLQCLLSSIFAVLAVCVVLFLTAGTIGLRTLAAFGLIFLFYVIGAVFKVRRQPKRKI